jgi:hypothetical protein
MLVGYFGSLRDSNPGATTKASCIVLLDDDDYDDSLEDWGGSEMHPPRLWMTELTERTALRGNNSMVQYFGFQTARPIRQLEKLLDQEFIGFWIDDSLKLRQVRLPRLEIFVPLRLIK